MDSINGALWLSSVEPTRSIKGDGRAGGKRGQSMYPQGPSLLAVGGQFWFLTLWVAPPIAMALAAFQDHSLALTFLSSRAQGASLPPKGFLNLAHIHVKSPVTVVYSFSIGACHLLPAGNPAETDVYINTLRLMDLDQSQSYFPSGRHILYRVSFIKLRNNFTNDILRNPFLVSLST